VLREFSTEFTVQTGTVEALVYPVASIIALSDAKLTSLLSGLVSVEDVVYEIHRLPMVEYDHTYDGAKVVMSGERCTSGFTVNQNGVLTAGHCNGNNGNYYEPAGGAVYPITHVGEHMGTWGDFQWHTTTHAEYDDFYVDNTLLRDVSSVQPVAGIVVGATYCRYGRTTGLQCDTVYKTSTTRYEGWTLIKKLVKMDHDEAEGGDSGGPWFIGSVAAGIHSGETSNKDQWSKAGYVDEALGVLIDTY